MRCRNVHVCLNLRLSLPSRKLKEQQVAIDAECTSGWSPGARASTLHETTIDQISVS